MRIVVHLPKMIASITLTLGGVILVGAQSDPLANLILERKRLQPFVGIYRESIRVGDIQHDEGTPGWGTQDSDKDVRAAIDAESSSLAYEAMDPGKPDESGGKRLFFRHGGTAYELIEGGRRGVFGSHPDGMINPAACGYEIGSLPAETFEKRNTCSADGPTAERATNDWVNWEISFVDDGGQIRVSRVVGTDKDGSGFDEVRVTDWVTFKGLKYPKRVTYHVEKGGRTVQDRAYTLEKILSNEDAPLSISFREGALITDEDKNITYDVRHGKLVPDPVFNREVASETTWRRIILLLSATAIGFWALARTRAKRRRTRPPTPAA